MSSESKLQTFLDWSVNNGSRIDERLQFKWTSSAGVTCYAQKTIGIETKPLISVPKKLLITNELARKHFTFMDKQLPTSNLNALTQLYLSHLKFNLDTSDKERDFFQPYLDILPLHMNQPYFWSSNELELLHGTDIFLKIKQNFSSLLEEFTELATILHIDVEDIPTSETVFTYIETHLNNLHSGNIQWNSFMAYLWSSSIFTSRAFPQLLIEPTIAREESSLAFLYPVVDLLNHKNDTNVKWEFEKDEERADFIFNETLKANDELFNNYGDKSKEELLLGYGFIPEDINPYDTSSLTLRLDENHISQARLLAKLPDVNLAADNCVQFSLSIKEPVPDSLFRLFGYLSKLKSENTLTSRSILEGSDELLTILTSKLDQLKNKGAISNSSKNCSPEIIRMVKNYFNSQRRIFQASIDFLPRFQKTILKKCAKECLSFKTIYKMDKRFSNSLLLSFGVVNFEDLIKKGYLKQALLLWIVRISNKDEYKDDNKFLNSSFHFLGIAECFQDVSSSIVIEKKDVMEYMSFYKSLFPMLGEKIPEVFDKGNWGLKQFIIADTVLDRLVWIRKLNQEPIFLKKQHLQL
ncbi:hypothetical protein NCAS_0C05970 [Naumovozyma castellii]|uniref:SET domain-containing protein n=1 Tax=Naumovozyma castellii TaxID=27288 RepID=G0VDM5_NAUCA|nr:hypothetical protein NCAS_0C05970 [Naumovozyma castellii CBS 4309]CCC69587.1 hypothetical protein NCAS_0C05970 [Naumovozyma castellii CBS 4309]